MNSATTMIELAPDLLRDVAELRGSEASIEEIPDIQRMVLSLDAMKQEDVSVALQFVSARPGEGTSSVAWAFARTAAAAYGRPTLYVNCVGPGSADLDCVSLTSAFLAHGNGKAAVRAWPELRRLSVAQLSAGPNPFVDLIGSDFQRLIETLKSEFALVVLDCPAASTSNVSFALSRFCDGSVLVIRAEQTRRQLVEWAGDGIAKYGGHVVGAVFNGRRRYIPSWLYRWI